MEADMCGRELGCRKKPLSALWKDTCYSNLRKLKDNWRRCGISGMS